MLAQISPRTGFVLIVLSCISLLAYALYNQYVEFLEPCPLCIFQRVAFVWMGLAALLAILHNPARFGRRIYAWLIVLGGGLGAAIAGRHIWLQSLPPDAVPECGPGLNYMLDTFPIMEVLSSVIRGSGSCAELDWTFLSLSMPTWTLIWYIGLSLFAIWIAYKAVRK